jgi:plastocyanin
MKQLRLAFLLVTASAIACSSSNGTTTPGTGGTSATAGTTGTAGASAGGTAGTSAGGTGGGTAGFMSIMPCTSESDYVAGTTISFGGSVGFAYDPKCLKVPAGTTVTFMGDFSSHPLEPSTHRGELTGNPITAVSALADGGTTTSFTFQTAGFYAYFCSFHGPSDTGAGMAGVIWVQ